MNSKLPVTPNPWKRQSSKKLFDNPWLTLHEDEVINPGGGISHYGKINFKNLAIGIIPLDENNNTWLVGQYRYVPDCYSWEIPMGGGPLNIDPLTSAQRELKEETGLIANDWQEIMQATYLKLRYRRTRISLCCARLNTRRNSI